MMMDTVFERDYLYKNRDVPLTGFKEKPINRLISVKQTPNVLSIEANHMKRDCVKNERDIVPLLEYRLWLEAGKLDKANLRSSNADPNVNINSNMWRNFCATVGIQPRSEVTTTATATSTGNKPKQVVSEAVATMYPINIPMPSRLGSNTLAKYYDQNKREFFVAAATNSPNDDDKAYRVMREHVEREDARMRLMRLKSEMRNPPLDVFAPAPFKRSSMSTMSLPTSSVSITNSQQQQQQQQANNNAAAAAASTSSSRLLVSRRSNNHPNTKISMLTGTFNPNDNMLINENESILNVKKRTPVLKRPLHRQNHPNFNSITTFKTLL